MELLLVLIYVSFCAVIFKLFKIPVNQWSLSTAVLGGILGIFLLLLVMNYNHPFSTNARIYFPVTPILPTVKGRVVEVPVRSNTPLKEGDVLFRIDPKPYEYVVDEKKAALAEAEQNVSQLKASLDEATAAAERTNAQLKLAQENYDRQAQLFEKNVVAQAALDTATRNLDAAKQGYTGAKAEEERERLAYTSNIGGVNTSVARARAQLGDAQFDLDQTTTRAAGPGFVTQVSLRPGMYVIPTQLRTAMLFVNTGRRDHELGAAFQQNSLQRVDAGDDAEVAFDAVPGRVFSGKVRSLVDAIAAIYTKHWHHLSLFAQNSAANAQLGELRILRGALVLRSPCSIDPAPVFTRKAWGFLFGRRLQRSASALCMCAVNWPVTDA